MTIAANMFKAIVLGDEHVPSKPQTSSVFDSLASSSVEFAVTDRTWQSWFSPHAGTPKAGKIKALDVAASALLRENAGGRDVPDEVGPFEALVHGGIVSALKVPSKAKDLRNPLAARAADYEPVSALHLHLDAIEVGELSAGVGDVPWMDVKALASRRILQVLNGLWSRRSGRVYQTFSSNLRLRWEAADDIGKQNIRATHARCVPDHFDNWMRAGAHPDWSVTGIELDAAPEHIYKTLFALAADAEFLVADRLSAWALDIATAALAMHACAWSDRYATFGWAITDEKIYWAALSQLLFDDEPPAANDSCMLAAHGTLQGCLERRQLAGPQPMSRYLSIPSRRCWGRAE